MENSKKCPNCGSTNIKEVDSPEDFLSRKPEGERAKAGKLKIKQNYYCYDCSNEWEEDIKYEQDI